MIGPTSSSSVSYDPLPGEIQPCADLRQLERGSLAEPPTFSKSTKLELSVCSSKTRIILIGTRGKYQCGWKEAENGSCVEEIDERR